MNRKFWILTSIPIVPVTLAMFAGSEIKAQDREAADEVRARIEAFYQEQNAAIDPENVQTGVRQVQMCQDFFTVDYIAQGTDPHLDIGYRFLIVGAHPISGQYQVTAVGPHSWRGPPKHYQAIPTVDPDVFDLWYVIVEPHNGGPAAYHYYQMEVAVWGDDGCPDYVYFHSIAHIPGAVILHPGHGGAGR